MNDTILIFDDSLDLYNALVKNKNLKSFNIFLKSNFKLSDLSVISKIGFQTIIVNFPDVDLNIMLDYLSANNLLPKRIIVIAQTLTPQVAQRLKEYGIDYVGVNANMDMIMRFLDSFMEECVNKKHITSNQIHDAINEELANIGIPINLIGRKYIADAVSLYYLNDNQKITSIVYPFIASQHNTSSKNVERAIRHAIEIAFMNNDLDVLYDVFGNTINPLKGKPTNTQFIKTLATRVKHRFS